MLRFRLDQETSSDDSNQQPQQRDRQRVGLKRVIALSGEEVVERTEVT